MSRRSTLVFLTIALIVFFIQVYYTSNQSTTHQLRNPFFSNATLRTQSGLRILKLTTLYPRSPHVYHAALKRQKEHNQLFRHDMQVLRKPIVRGATNFVYGLQRTVLEELSKKVEDRAYWILYFDPSTILLNTSFPLYDLLPPADNHETFRALTMITPAPSYTSPDVSLLTFFLRVDPLSVHLLTLVAAQILEDETAAREGDGELVRQAFERVLAREEWKDKVIRQPESWYGGNEGKELFWRAQARLGAAHAKTLLKMERVLAGLEDDKKISRGPSAEDVEMFWRAVVLDREASQGKMV